MDQGFSKIKLENNNSRENSPDIKKRIFKKWFLIILLVTLLLPVLLFLPARRMYIEAAKTVEEGKVVAEALKNQDIEKTKTELEKTKEQLGRTRKAYSFFVFLKYIPFVGSYYKDGDYLLTALDASLDGAYIATTALIPYADLLGLKGESKFVAKSTDERIQTAVQTLDKLTPALGEIGKKIDVVRVNLDKINFNRYPRKIGQVEVRDKLLFYKSTFDEVSSLFINAQPLLENLPKILGEPEPKKYLIIFQNDKELRPTGGFITAYALFRLEKGKAVVETSDDIYKLDERISSRLSPPKQFINHLKVYTLYLRDANFSPDFRESMERFEKIYQSIPGTASIDGIIAVDTHVLVEAMKILGPIPAYGTNFTVENDERCNCPQVIYALEEYAGRRVGYIRESRKDIIGVLLYQIMQKALGVSPGEYWGKLFQMVLSEFRQKHILVYLHDEVSQKSLESLNFAGRMVEGGSGDYLHINDANLGGAKSNMFVKHIIKMEYEKASDGRIIKTLTIDYKNPNPGSKGCNLEAGGLCLNGLMPNWVRIYVPKGSELLDFQGSEDPPTTGEEYNKTVFEGFITVKPESVTQIRVKYKLPSSLTGKSFPLYLQKQPGTEGHEFTLIVNGKEMEIFKLTEDRKIEIR